MDTRLVLAVLFVAGNITLATVTAQNETVSTAAPGTNATAAPGTNATAAPGTNATAAPGTNATAAPGTNATAAPGTNAPGTNATAAPGTNATAAPGTNATAAPGTNATPAPGTNTTAAPGTNTTVSVTGNNPSATTEAPPLVYNVTVESLSTNISRAGCRSQELCMAQPLDCDPATGSCYFLAVKQKSGQNFEFGLVGEADGYLAATLSRTIELVNASTYICAKKNGKVFFISTVNENGKLTQKQLNVNSVKGRINGGKIECSFAATLPSPVTRESTSTSMSIAISTGTYNSSTDELGTPKTIFQSPVVDLTNVNASVTSVANTTTSTPTSTPNHAITLQQSLAQALMITMGVLCLAML